MQTNDVKQYWLNPNYFKKTKRSVGIFSFFLPQMSKRRTSALLPITGYRFKKRVNLHTVNSMLHSKDKINLIFFRGGF